MQTASGEKGQLEVTLGVGGGVESRMEKAGVGGEVGDTEPVEAEFWTDNCQTMKGTGGILKQGPWVRVTPALRR